MPNQENRCDKEKLPGKSSSSTGQLSLKSSGEVVLNYEETAAKAPEGKRIHPRRPVPSVPEARSEQTGEEKQANQSDSEVSSPQ
jgi:hypothetical protein